MPGSAPAAAPPETMTLTPAGRALMATAAVRGLVRRAYDGSRFAMVGFLGIGVNQALLWLLAGVVGIHYLLAAVIATQGSTSFNFAGIEYWVFRGRRRPGIVRRFVAFDALNSVALVLRVPALAVLVSGLGMSYLIGNLVTIVGLTVLRFVICDGVIWSPRRAHMGAMA